MSPVRTLYTRRRRGSAFGRRSSSVPSCSWLRCATRTAIGGSSHITDACRCQLRTAVTSDRRSRRVTDSFGGFTYEIKVCSGVGLPDDRVRYLEACPPPHIELLAGLPSAGTRFAPGIPDDVEGDARPCACDPELSYMNCAPAPHRRARPLRPLLLPLRRRLLLAAPRRAEARAPPGRRRAHLEPRRRLGRREASSDDSGGAEWAE